MVFISLRLYKRENKTRGNIIVAIRKIKYIFLRNSGKTANNPVLKIIHSPVRGINRG
jgi:hypothetical protein